MKLAGKNVGPKQKRNDPTPVSNPSLQDSSEFVQLPGAFGAFGGYSATADDK